MSAIDTATEFGAHVAERLRRDDVIWLTTVSAKGAPVPSPVWFLWDGADTVRLYSLDGARIRNLAANPRVTLNFDGNGSGGDIVILSGTARVAPEVPPADQDAEYVTKYTGGLQRLGYTPAQFAAEYKVPVEITVSAVRGH
jgi:PPOX class probable F420-dependent enzyme